MIQQNEIRIGNKIFIENQKAITVSPNAIGHVCDGFGDFYKPIPLDLLWFELMGFKKHHSQLMQEDGTLLRLYPLEKNPSCYFLAWADRDENKSSVVYRCYQDEVSPRLYYVHQMQNIYHALTGMELLIGVAPIKTKPRTIPGAEYKFTKPFTCESWDDADHIIPIGFVLVKTHNHLITSEYQVYTDLGIPCQYFFRKPAESTIGDYLEKIGD